MMNREERRHFKVCLVGINTPVLLPPGVEPSEHEREYFSTPSKEEAEKVFENLESLSEYISDIVGYEVDTSEVAVHAIAGYQEGGHIHIVHSRIREPEDLWHLAKTCPDSEIRIVFVTPDGGTFAEDVWSANIFDC